MVADYVASDWFASESPIGTREDDNTPRTMPSNKGMKRAPQKVEQRCLLCHRQFSTKGGLSCHITRMHSGRPLMVSLFL